MRAYSVEFRTKVIMAYHQTEQKSKVCQKFNISRSTLNEWIKLETETQSLEPLPPNTPIGRKSKIQDMNSFKEFVNTTKFSKTTDLLDLFKKRFGYQISYAVLWRNLHKIGYIKNKKQQQDQILNSYN